MSRMFGCLDVYDFFISDLVISMNKIYFRVGMCFTSRDQGDKYMLNDMVSNLGESCKHIPDTVTSLVM